MFKVNSTNDIQWFDIENYKYINKLSDIDLLNELMIRRQLNKESNTDLEKRDFLGPYWKGIISGKPDSRVISEEVATVEEQEMNDYLETLPLEERENYKGNDCLFDVQLSSDDAVHPIGILELLKLNSTLEKLGLYIKDGEYSYFKDNSLYGSLSHMFNENKVVCEISLVDYSDEEIISSLRAHLPKWRNKMSILEPDKRHIKQSEVSKIKTYNIIPLIDLLIWEAQSNTSIPKRVLAAALFPFGEMGSEDLSGGNAKISNLLTKLLQDDLSLTNITGDFHL